jgi:ribonuclease-3
MARRKVQRSDLEARIGHSFADPDLLTRALTHVSAAGSSKGRNYQRLEFLGDRVLGLAVAEMLIEAFPHAPEGELSQRLSELVRRETCAGIAEAWDVGPHLLLGTGEMQSGGRANRAILSDAAESILGAVFMDAGYGTARKLVQAALASQLTAAVTPPRDAKTALQEWARGRPADPGLCRDRASRPRPCPEFPRGGPDQGSRRFDRQRRLEARRRTGCGRDDAASRGRLDRPGQDRASQGRCPNQPTGLLGRQ